MLRILLFFAVVLAAGLGFAWLADHPGSVSIAWLGREVELTFLVFLAATILGLVVLLALLWLLSRFFGAPGRIGAYVSGRNREKGYRALTGGILAAGAGDAQTARRLVGKAQRYLEPKKEPLLRFLDAQTAMIEGDHQRALKAFETMEKDPDTRLLALRGLFLESERVNDPVAARHYAEQAVRIAPHVPWAGSAVLELKAAEGDFDAALEILKAQRRNGLVGKPESQRLRAVLLTGKAQSLLAADPSSARALALEAQKLSPDLVPAALAAARAAIAVGDPRRASKVLEKAWAHQPHREIAELYVHSRPGENAADRLSRAKKLQQMQPRELESHLAVAHAALEAGALQLARREAEEAAAMAPREAVFLLLADIEQAEGGGQERVRAQMARAIRAPKDATWMADGVASPSWNAVSPVTGRLDAYRWTEPNETPSPMRIVSRTEDAKALEAANGVRSHSTELVVGERPRDDEASGIESPSGPPASGSDAKRKDGRFDL